jgi:DNA-binding winged helix-turn-helix (wHTH) protein/class 3 adenylate cyclase/tetratricopeptide (TPR) repeat protein
MRYLFGDYVLDTQRYELHGAGELVKLRRKAFQVLAYLLAHHERVVSKQELLEHLWPNQFVGDEVLKACITALRKALGERGRTPRFIRTLHGQGYRFVAAVAVQAPLPVDNALPALSFHASPRPEAGGGEGARENGSGLQQLPPVVIEALDGEHKQATVLCGALAGVPSLVVQLGPEAMYHLMHAVLALVQETTQRYGGTLLQVSGDGFLALFGAPVAQEDHARRAVLVALELQQRLPLYPPVRKQAEAVAVTACMGLHTGPVVVGHLSYLPQGLYTAAGEVTQLATQLQHLAAPCVILMSAATYRLVQEDVRSVAAGTLNGDVRQPPMAVYTVQGLRQRRAGVPGRGPRSMTPFVGRAQELALLHDRLAQAAQGQGQVIGIAGEPGLGKSRLLVEFRQTLAGQAVTYYEGHCLPYDSATPYGPLRALLRQHCGLTDPVPPAVCSTAGHRVLREAGLASVEAAPLLLQLLDVPDAAAPGLPLTPEERRAHTFALLRQLFLHASQRQPLILVVENLHWIDATSEAWLTTLVAQLPSAALLLLVTHRPTYRAPWLGQSAATQVALPGLRPTDSRVVVQAVAQGIPLPEPLVQALVAKAGGNPFFLEELTQAVAAHGPYDATLPLPDTIQAVLAARIDRLPAEEKRLLQTAAVIGTEVPVPLLQAIADVPEAVLHSGLLHLQAAEFLYETRLSPAPEYTFRHALTHEVAYGSLLLERRRVLHARIVEALEAVAPERGTEQVERLAHHAPRGEVWNKAVTYCQQAGARAYDRAAFREAVAAFEQALEAFAHLPEDGDTRVQAIELRLAMQRPLNALGEYSRGLALLGEAETLARALDDRARLVQVLAAMGQRHRVMGDNDGAMAVGQRAVALAAALGDDALQVQASYTLGQTYYDIGDFGRAAELQRRTMEAADRASGTSSTDLRIQSRARLATILGALGAFAEGRCHGEKALRLATLAGRGNMPIIAHSSLGLLYLAQGDLEQAIRVLEQGLALCRASGNRDWLRGTGAGLGYAYALQGRLAEGRALLEEAISEAIRTNALQGNAYRLVWLSEVCRLARRSEEAGQHVHQALDLARQQKARGDEAFALHQLGVVQAHTDPPDLAQAETYYRQALALANELSMRPLVAHCHHGLGTLYARIGHREQACAALTTAIALYCAMEMPFWLPQAEAALAQGA